LGNRWGIDGVQSKIRITNCEAVIDLFKGGGVGRSHWQADGEGSDDFFMVIFLFRSVFGSGGV
jgi:hypothetical protein